MIRTTIKVIALLAPVAAVFACSSTPAGTGGAGGGAGTTSSSSTSSSTSSTTSSSTSSTTSSSGTTDGGTDGGKAACQMACAANNSAGYTAFSGDELASCGCGATSTCKSECTASCGDGGVPNGTTPDTACATCLSTEEGKGATSPCTLAAVGSCTSTACTTFLACAQACM